ncbi:MAG: hypothetical protein KOO60_10055 [Gemmatimonadales bacterium]|nr:hypothetical protein [Gemmatimonadales bacterium]
MVKLKVTLFPAMALAILALVGCGNDSGNPVAPVFEEETAEVVVVDTAPPAVPTGLAAASSTTVLKLAWDPNVVDLDFQGFLVYRLAFENSYLLTPAPIGENYFVDQQPLGISCGYAISAIDEAGNESAWLEVRYNPPLEEPEMRISM